MYKMARTIVSLTTNVFLLLFSLALSVKYEPNWDSLDKRPLPEWYDASKVGIFIHWGVFSVPSFRSEWFWWDWQGAKDKDVIAFMQENYRPDFTYADFAPKFTSEFFNPEQWADIFQASGAQNKTSIHFGLYHSLFEWFHPLYLQDKANKFTTQNFVKSKTLPELYEIVNQYKPDVIWSDGDWEALDTYWNSTEFIAWLYNESPVKDTVVTNDRWGVGVMCKHGGFLTCSDRFNPGKLQKRKWENAMTIDKQSWGYRRNAPLSDYLTMDELIQTLVETVSCGGNILINVGPTHDGRIPPVFEERLRQLGSWLKINGEAIYNTDPWMSHQNDTLTPNVWYTTPVFGPANILYAIVLSSSIPRGTTLTLGAPRVDNQATVTLFGYNGTLSYKPVPGGGITINIPNMSVKDAPPTWAWVFRIINIKNKPVH
ncbi:hypothetical protein FSP39_023336 [Pinctada imbricata]|uniref:alpha-L-fucosidase n=1 Tax=Pinctada imbricata TaxID=66713 RepID=A0AA88YEY5_PINIB|nr:hypothetical protein FSP39_023336 [Pinctada imbricata]